MLQHVASRIFTIYKSHFLVLPGPNREATNYKYRSKTPVMLSLYCIKSSSDARIIGSVAAGLPDKISDTPIP